MPFSARCMKQWFIHFRPRIFKSQLHADKFKKQYFIIFNQHDKFLICPEKHADKG